MHLKQMAVLLSCAVASGALLSAANEADKRLQWCFTVLSEIMAISDKSIPQDLLNRAQCIVIVPGLKKAGFIIGG